MSNEQNVRSHPHPAAILPATKQVSFRAQFLTPFRDPNVSQGMLLVAASGGLFLLGDWLVGQKGNDGTPVVLFIIHYLIAQFFSVVLLLGGYLNRQPDALAHRRPAGLLSLLLWLISAYALNRSLPVFQPSTTWLCVYLTLFGIALVAYAWKDLFSVRGQQLLYAGLTMGWLLCVYLMVSLGPLYLISIPGLLALGLSFHTFVPLLLVIILGRRIWLDSRANEHLRLGVGLGLVMPLLITGVFLARWIQIVRRMEQTQQEATIRRTGDLPGWLLVGQAIGQPSWLTERVLLSGWLYRQGLFTNGQVMNTSMGDARLHDPLVSLTAAVYPVHALSEQEQLSMLRVLLGKRHDSAEKLWSGRNLTVNDAVTQVRIWPTYRMSYTEQTLSIRNQHPNTTEEALFTFHLPTGSVVSSMSLWVNGQEEPARLTTHANADSAYQRVVGVESRVQRRDPAVVQWQEGNRVTLRVFPCSAREDRRVKIGITSPLQLIAGQLLYQKPYLEGPPVKSADELTDISFETAPTDLHLPWLFSSLSNNRLTHQGTYDPDWTLTFQAPPLATTPFSLDGKTYRAAELKPGLIRFAPTDVYLDVTNAWTNDEFQTVVRSALKRGRVWVFDDGMQQLTPQTMDEIYGRLAKQSFSLFPVYRINDPAHALLITKGTTLSPTLTDVKNSPYADRLKFVSHQLAPIPTFCLSAEAGQDTPTYIRSLADLRVLKLMSGSLAELDRYIERKQFPVFDEAANRVTLPQSGMSISQTDEPATGANTAPDHLVRLFVYNHLLHRIGRQFFAENYQTNDLLWEAQQANVVSPVSSLIVLETAPDYERFGIKKDKHGLDNATLKQEGAVPEPHEWALLLLLAGVAAGWLYWKKRYALR